MPASPTFLTDCEKLQADASVECTEFSRFVLLKPQREHRTRKPPVATLPTGYKLRDPERLEAIAGKTRSVLRTLAYKFPIDLTPVRIPPGTTTPPARGGPTPTDTGTGRPRPDRDAVRHVEIAGLGRIEMRGDKPLARADLAVAMMNLSPRAIGSTVTSLAKGGTPAGSKHKVEISSLVAPLLRAIQDYTFIAAEARSKATWAIGMTFRQCWHSHGYLRGRLVRSIPLTPGEQLEVVIKTWDRRTTRKSQVESIARNLSTEVTGEEKWMLAAKMTFGDQANASINPTAGANGGLTIPIDTITATLGGNLGIAGNFSNQLSQSTQQSTDYIHSSMVKAAQSLQSTRTNSVDVSHESGEEVSRRQVIANTNRCRTLTYHYFEVMERFEVRTRLHDVALHLLIPLPVPEITPEWVLCNECYLRKTLQCPTLYAGLDGAKTLLEWRKLIELYPPVGVAPTTDSGTGGKGGGAGSTSTSAFANAVDDLLKRWRIMKNAELLATIESPDVIGMIGETGQKIADGLMQFVSDVKDGADKAIDDAGKVVDEGLAAIGEGIQAAGEWVGDAIGGLFFSTAPGATMLSTSAPQGGPGTWLYREVAKIASPQIADGMTFLETAWPQTQSLAAGERAIAELNVLTVFFSKLGMPSFTFGKVDALFAGAAAAGVAAGGIGGGVTGAVVGGATGAAIAVWGFGVSAIPGAVVGAAVGGAAGAALGAGSVAAALAVIASIEALGFADTVPDDLGLGDAATRLKALLDSTMSIAPAVGIPGAGGTPGSSSDPAAGPSAEDQWREQMRALATASVEFERLACHIRKNLSTYLQGLWGRWTDAQILAEVRRHGIPEHVIAPRFAGFHAFMGALPVIDHDWVEKEGDLKWRAVREELLRSDAAKSRTEEITLATPGMTVEPSLGHCDACEPFIHEHRKLDLEHRRAEVDAQNAQAQQQANEAARFQKRIEQGLLDDPTPFEGASVTVDAPKPDGGQP